MTSELELRPETKEFLFTLFKYVECHKLLDEKYQQVDEGGILATRTLESQGIIVEKANFENKAVVYKPEFQQQTISGAIVESLDDLYAAAKLAQPVFMDTIQRLMQPVQDSCGCTSLFYHPTKSQASTTPPPLPSSVVGKRPFGSMAGTTERMIKVTIAPFKGRERALEKAQDDYSHRNPGPGFSWLFDIVRASIEFGSVEQILTFMDVLESDPFIQVVQAKNRFSNPTLTGYRDLNLHVQIQVPATKGEGAKSFQHVCEIQIHHGAIMELQGQLESHKYYEYFRSFFGGATGTLKSRFEDSQQIGNGMALDEGMLTHFLKTNMDEEHIMLLGRLFEDQFAELDWALRIQRRLLVIRKKKYNLSIKVAEWKKLSELAKEDVEFKARALSSTYRDMGRIMVKRGQIDEALKLYRQSRKESYKMNRDTSDRGTYCQENDLLVAEAHNIIGILETKRNSFRRALGMHKVALDIYKQALGTLHPLVAVTYGNMGNALSKMEQCDKAMECYTMCLDIFQLNLGDDHFCVWNTLNNIGVLLSEQGKYQDALNKFEESLSSSAAALGVGPHQQSHPFRANVYNNMGVALERLYCSDEADNYKKEKWLEQAVSNYPMALETYKKVLGDDHFDMIGTYNNVANALAKQGMLDDSIDMLNKSISIQSKVFGKDHLDLVPLYKAKMRLCQMHHSSDQELVEISDEMKRIRKAHDPREKKYAYGMFGHYHSLPGGYKPMWNKHRTWHTMQWNDQLQHSLRTRELP